MSRLVLFVWISLVLHVRGQVCPENQIIIMTKAFLRSIQPTAIIFFDINYLQELDQEIRVSAIFLGAHLEERNEYLARLLNKKKGTYLIIANNSIDIQVMQGQTQKHYWLLPKFIPINQISLRLDSLVFLFECNGSIIYINESYGTMGKIRVDREIWQLDVESSNLPLSLSDGSLWERRADLGGITLVNMYLPYPTQNLPVIDQDGEVVDHTGYLAEILKVLEDALNFTTLWLVTEDLTWGSLDANGSWNGLMRKLVDHKVDISTSGLLNNPQRFDYVEFSVPTNKIVTSVTTAHRGKRSKVNVAAYISIFTTWVWIACFITLALVVLSWWSIMTNLAAKPKDRIQQNYFSTKLDKVIRPYSEEEDFEIEGTNNNRRHGHNCDLVTKSLALVGNLLLLLNYTMTFNSRSTKFLFLLTGLLGFVLHAHYAAVLTSLMTVRPPALKIRNFQDILDLGLDVFVWKDSALSLQMSNAVQGTAQYKANQQMLDNPDTSFLDDQAAITERVHNDPDSIYYGPTSAFLQDPRVKVYLIEERRESWIGFTFPKGSELVKLFNYHMIKLRERGLFAVHMNHHMKLMHTDHDYQVEDATVLGYENVFLPVGILLSGIVVSVTIGLCERTRLGRVKMGRQ